MPTQQICNPFCKGVLKHYKKLHTKCLPENTHNFVSECIHCNVSITINKRVVYITDWFDAGIVFVHHLMDNKGNDLTFETFKQIFPNVRTIFFMYWCYKEISTSDQSRISSQLQSTRTKNVVVHSDGVNKCLKSLSVKSEALPLVLEDGKRSLRIPTDFCVFHDFALLRYICN